MSSCNWTASYENVTGCGVDVEDDDDLVGLRQSVELTRFVIQRVLAPTVIAAGIIANVLTIVVLTRRAMPRSSTNVYLTALAVYDAAYLALAFTMTWKHYDAVRSRPWFVRYRLPVGRPLIDSASNTAVWLIVTFTVERFIGVRFPMKGKVWCTSRRAIYVVVVVCVAAFLVTLPEFFEFHVVVEQQSSPANHSTALPAQLVLRPELTEFGDSPGYQLGYNYVNQSLFTFLPLLLLFVFNSLLVKAVLSAARLRHAMTGRTAALSAQHKSTADREATEQRITVMLISVVVVFLVCQLPQAILKLYTVYLESTPGAVTTRRRLQLLIGGNVCNLLVVVNSAVNFILYSALSAKFRQTFRRTFCRCCGVARSRRRRSSASVVDETAVVPLATSVDVDARRPTRRPRTASTNLDDEHVTADTRDQTLLDGAAVNS